MWRSERSEKGAVICFWSVEVGASSWVTHGFLMRGQFAMPQVLDHAANIYLSVTLSPASSLFSRPSALSVGHSLLTYQGQVGSLSDVQLYSVPRGQPNWNAIQDEVLKGIREREGVVRVDIVQPPKQRSKRGDEL
jgi:hypothetical protein